MAGENSKNIVLDADIMRAASEHVVGRSQKAWELLECIRDICHKVVINKFLFEEYLNHPSRSNLQWLAAMRSIGKEVDLGNTTENKELRKKILSNLAHPNAKKAVQKDLHLIELALKGDKIIFSFDDKARNHITTAVSSVKEIQDLIWQNPDIAGEDDFCEWLKNIANQDLERRKLGYIQKK